MTSGKYCIDANVSFVFTVPCRLNRFFNVKDVTPVNILSNIFYKFQCSRLAVMLFMSAKLTDIFMLERMITWVHPTELVAILLLDHVLQ